jgi:hypothetical protein
MNNTRLPFSQVSHTKKSGTTCWYQSEDCNNVLSCLAGCESWRQGRLLQHFVKTQHGWVRPVATLKPGIDGKGKHSLIFFQRNLVGRVGKGQVLAEWPILIPKRCSWIGESRKECHIVALPEFVSIR